MDSILNEDIIPKILVVDDSTTLLSLIKGVLTVNKYEVITAESGAAAIETAYNDFPDLILLDIMMPGMDGFETCKILKSNEITANIPVIFLTAKTSKQDIVEGLECGGVDYITKPFDNKELLARIYTHLELKYARQIIEEQKIELENLVEELRISNEMLEERTHDLLVLREKMGESD